MPIGQALAEIGPLQPATPAWLDPAALPPLRTAASVDSQGDRHVVYVEDAEGFVSDLVFSGTPFAELEVVPVSLEDAFVTLTTEAEP